MEVIYLDNAATTAMDPLVLEAMLPYMTAHFGNPSSAYSLGRQTRSAIETSRRKVADLLGVKPATICFNSGGTEGNNTAIAMALKHLKCTHVITSPLEHHAVLHTVKHYCTAMNLSYSYLQLLPNGEVDLDDLENQLKNLAAQQKKCLVTLMHANNEIGTLLDLEKTGLICKTYDAVFHSDCVQTIGHYPINFSQYHLHFATAAGHKFQGPKGTGMLYVNEKLKLQPLIFGGGQERNTRAGTENVSGIIGFAKALDLSMQNFVTDEQRILELKDLLRNKLVSLIPGISFNNPDHSLYTILSACFPINMPVDLLLLQFDLAGLCVSGGSACSSGDDSGSHVIKALNRLALGATIRFSFSKNNTVNDVDKAVQIVQNILAKDKAVNY